MLGWRVLAVRGPSMVPTLRTGEWLLVRSGARVRPGAVVVGRFRDLPDVIVVKRAQARRGDGWVLSSDNPFAASGARTHGLADVAGVVVVVIGRRGRPRRPAPRMGGPGGPGGAQATISGE